ncbi:rod-binding protein [Desulfovibrio cuneatus]|uniref:rod-binding protein n=1 Tax=Desulfovibrio cuneatus TaxID=159728 RepID=UPI0006845429|nr:rod-binding protein [Desulfovibrio cuneatus]
MTTSAPVDPRAAMDQSAQLDLVHRKMAMDDLRNRMGNSKDKDGKLRDACEGFESIFIQRMWEQMRKNVPKEGYLHSKDEETYQSMFDVELSKKMASAGGIGLAEVLYQQLSSRATNAARGTSPGAMDNKQPLHGVQVPAAPPQELEAAAQPVVEKLTQENLYSTYTPEAEGEAPNAGQEPLAQNPKPEGEAVAQEEAGAGQGPMAAISGVVANAIAALRAEVGEGLFATEGPAAALPEGVLNAKKTPRGLLPQEAAWPYEGQITGRFGWQDDPSGKRRWNPGVSIAVNPGDAITPCLPGRVVYVGERGEYGDSIVLEHADGFMSFYGNVQGNDLKVGDAVAAGTPFARVTANPGFIAEGEKTAPLFFEIKRGEMALNPEAAIKTAMVASVPTR